MKVVCQRCGRPHVLGATFWRCECEGLFQLLDDAHSHYQNSQPPRIGGSTSSIRHADAPGRRLPWPEVSLGESMTPLVLLTGHRRDVDIFGKLEYLMPTLSFKDRGATVLVAAARSYGVRHMIADSSGNAGTAIAAYAARAGIMLDVYVPAATSEKKIAQMLAHGAAVHRQQGDRAAAAAAAITAVEKSGSFYASHVYNPLFVAGVRTYAFELVAQFGGEAPDLVVAPVGNGTLVLGAYYGFRHLYRTGLLAALPPILAVQAQRCAPIAEAFTIGAHHVEPAADDRGTVAEGIAIASPPRGAEVLAAIRSSAGHMVTVAEDAIRSAHQALARQGLYVEPTAAATYAGLLAWLDGDGARWVSAHREIHRRSAQIVVPLCGAGLKAA